MNSGNWPLGIQEIEGRLLELGCPPGRWEREVRELAEHHQDLKAAALQEGVSEAEAEARATQLLGEAATLAGQLAAAARQSSWWGRHRIIAYCLLPLPAILMASGLGVAVGVGLLRPWFSADEWAVLADEGAGFTVLVAAVQGAYCAAIALVTCALCWRARRSVSGPAWALAACGVCAVQAGFCCCQVFPYGVAIGYRFCPNWGCGAVPLLVGVVFLSRQWRRGARRRRGPGLSGWFPGRLAATEVPSVGSGRAGWRRRLYRSPTCWVMVLLMSAIAGFALWVRAEYLFWTRADQARQVELRTRIWPAERAAVERQFRAAQRAEVGERQRPIDLGPWVNAALAEAGEQPAGAKGMPAGARAEAAEPWPAGVKALAGVRFEVQGKVQLMGRGWRKAGHAFPSRAKGIRVGQKCASLHLLHGALFVGPSEAEWGTSVANLVLRYADGSQKRLAILAGEHVLNWWGPVVKSDVQHSRPRSPTTELAWAGSSPQLTRSHPDCAFRLYRTTFANPHPDLELATLDYESTLSEAAPFLVALTVGQER